MDKITTVNAEQFKDSVFFRIVLKMPSFKKQVKDAAALEQYLALRRAEKAAREAAGETVTDQSAVSYAGNGDVPKNSKAAKATSTTKTLLQSPALDALREHLQSAKHRICAPPQYGGIANPSGIMEGLFEVHKDLVPRVNAIVAEARDRLENSWVDDQMDSKPGFIDAFLADYPAAIERARSAPLLDGGLGPLFNAGDYPSEEKIRASFDIVRRWLSFSVPEGLPPELREQALNELKADLNNAAETIKNALAEGLLKLCEHANEVLQTQPGEKPKVIKESLIGNILQFCETFPVRNTQNDQELAPIVEQCKAALTGLDPDKLRKFPSVRENAAKQFEAISATLDTMIETRKSRKLYLED